jgi:hypothetical protein
MSASILLFALAASGVAPPVSMELTTAQQVLLVGEPLRLNLRWRAHRDVTLPPEPGWESIAGVRVWISTGGREREYAEAIRSVREELIIVSPLRAGREHSWDLLLHMGVYEPARGDAVPQLAFAREGRYRVQIAYGGDGWQVRSNGLTITVAEPKGEDRALLDELGRDIRSLKYGHLRVRRLLERYPRSPYLQVARVHAFVMQENAVMLGRDPETGLELPDLTARAPDELTRARQAGARRLVEQLSAQGNWGAFEDVRLGFIERHARFSGDVQTAEHAAKELKARYPRSTLTQTLRLEQRVDAPRD